MAYAPLRLNVHDTYNFIYRSSQVGYHIPGTAIAYRIYDAMLSMQSASRLRLLHDYFNADCDIQKITNSPISVMPSEARACVILFKCISISHIHIALYKFDIDTGEARNIHKSKAQVANPAHVLERPYLTKIHTNFRHN